MHLSQVTRAAAGLAVTAALLTGCGSQQAADPAASDAGAATASGSTDEASSITMADAWVKAADAGEMTAAFGVLRNEADADATVESASSDVSTMTELHETVESSDGTMAMQPKDGGFTVPAGGSLELGPGGDHIMFMGLARDLEPGEDVTVTLTLGDGSTVDVTAPVKEFDGAEEEYQPDGDSHGEDSRGDMEEMEDMSDGSSSSP